MDEEYLQYLLSLPVPKVANSPAMEQYIGKMDARNFENEQNIREVEEFQARQHNDYIRRMEAL